MQSPPSDTDDRLYLESEYATFTVEDLLERIRKKWPGRDPLRAEISTKWLNERGCSCHPHPSDFVSYILIDAPEFPQP